jgi:nitroreductase/ferredoxin
MSQTKLLEYAKPGVQRPLEFMVDETLCTDCGLCGRDCPMGLIQGNPPRVERADLCIRCQHCMAICPPGAISIEGRKVQDSLPLAKGNVPALEHMVQLVQGRRSIRQYQDRDVDPILLQRLLKVAAYAPTGVNARQLTFTVVDQKAVLGRLRDQVLAVVARSAKEGRIPERLGFLAAAPAAFTEHGIDMIFRGAPHLLLVSAPLEAPTGQTDVTIALAAFELLAASAGLGTVWCGMLKVALEIAPDLKPLLDLPAEGVHYYPMLFGYPAVKYARAVQRDGAAVIKHVS